MRLEYRSNETGACAECGKPMMIKSDVLPVWRGPKGEGPFCSSKCRQSVNPGVHNRAPSAARRFAREWYARPESGKDEATMQHLLEQSMRDLWKEAQDEVRQKVLTSLKQLLSL